MSGGNGGGYVLLNIAHHHRRPSAPRAAFRLLGVFSSPDEVRLHVQNLLTPDVDMHLAEVGRFFALMRDADQDEGAHLRRVQEGYSQRLREHAEDFRENVCLRRTGETTHAPPDDERSAAEPERPPPAAQDGPSAVPRSAELRLQNFAVVSVMQDEAEPLRERQQPCVVVWAVYDTEEQAKVAIKERHARLVTDLHLEVVQLYEWLHPTEVAEHLDELQEEFRDEKLTELIRSRKAEARNVRAYRQSCGDREPPLIDFSRPEVRISGPEAPGELAELTAAPAAAPA
jgi:hypothetical protein